MTGQPGAPGRVRLGWASKELPGHCQCFRDTGPEPGSGLSKGEGRPRGGWCRGAEEQCPGSGQAVVPGGPAQASSWAKRNLERF